MSRYTVRPTSVGLLSRGRDYSVKDLGDSPAGYTKMLEKELGVSLRADAPQTRWTQLHELSHVKHSLWSPGRIAMRMERIGKRISTGSILAAEDARINELLIRRVRDAHRGFEIAHADKLRRDLDGYVASHASPPVLADAIRPACEPAHVAAVDAFLARLAGMPDRELSVLRVTVPLAQLMDDLKAGRMPEAGEEDGKGADGKAEGEGDAAPESGDSDGDGDSDAELEDAAPGEADGKPRPVAEPRKGDGKDAGEDEDGEDTGEEDAEDGTAGESGDGAHECADDSAGDGLEGGTGGEDGAADAGGSDPGAEDDEAFGKPDAHTTDCTGGVAGVPGDKTAAPWVIPHVVEPELTVPLRTGNFQAVTAETGSTIRWAHLHRIQTDGVVFRRARRRPGALQRGTVLIDVSGSMNFTDASLDALVNMLPHATVAVYSTGMTRYGDMTRYGNAAWIVVVARNGRRVASLASIPRGSGNGCDGPALLWLSRQPAPRLWICDGAVTGEGDYSEAWQAEEAAAIMQAAGIIQVCGKVRWLDGHRTYGKPGLRATRTLLGLKDGALIGPETQADLAGYLRPVLKDIERGRI